MENKNWPDSIRLEMVAKSEFYQDPTVYQYGYYDGYQKAISSPSTGEDVQRMAESKYEWQNDFYANVGYDYAEHIPEIKDSVELFQSYIDMGRFAAHPPTSVPDNWIKIEEGGDMPEDFYSVLLYFPELQQSCTGYKSPDGWVAHSRIINRDKPTHYMKLPTPPNN